VICLDCASVLSPEETHYYGARCEACERADLACYQAWRHGAADPDLDKAYSAPPPTIH